MAGANKETTLAAGEFDLKGGVCHTPCDPAQGAHSEKRCALCTLIMSAAAT